MKHRLLMCVALLALSLAPTIAMAAKGGGPDEEELVKMEARLEGYPNTVRLPNGGSTLTAMMVIFLSVVAVCTLLKNAKRTHLD